MKCYKPDYYDRFRCLASACPDTCCQQWDIDVDEKSASYYETLTGDLGDKIRRSLKKSEDGPVIALQNGKCPLCRSDGLCELQVNLGHQALCEVCRTFPRLHHDYGNFMELGLELSCPEAARLILTKPYTVSCREIPGGEEPGYDQELMEILLRTRREFLEYLEIASMEIPQILAVLLLYGCSVQSEIDGGEQAVLRPEEDLAEAVSYASKPDFNAVIAFFRNLEILTDEWHDLLQSPAFQNSWQPCHRSLLRYFIERYWLQAVSDYDLICRIKFIIVSCILVKSLPGDPVWNAHLFSKEIENDCDNVDTILDACYSSPAFTDQNLISLLLH